MNDAATMHTPQPDAALRSDPQRPRAEIRLRGQCLLIAGNPAFFELLGQSLSERPEGSAYAELALAGDGTPRAVCALCCADGEVVAADHDDPRVAAALDELFWYYTTEDPVPEEQRYGLERNGKVIRLPLAQR